MAEIKLDSLGRFANPEDAKSRATPDVAKGATHELGSTTVDAQGRLVKEAVAKKTTKAKAESKAE